MPDLVLLMMVWSGVNSCGWRGPHSWLRAKYKLVQISAMQAGGKIFFNHRKNGGNLDKFVLGHTQAGKISVTLPRLPNRVYRFYPNSFDDRGKRCFLSAHNPQKKTCVLDPE